MKTYDRLVLRTAHHLHVRVLVLGDPSFVVHALFHLLLLLVLLD